MQKTLGGEGFADVWMRGYFAWEYKGKHKDLVAAYQQLLQYREDLENPPLLVVCDLDRFEVHTNFTNTQKRVFAFELADLLRNDPSAINEVALDLRRGTALCERTANGRHRVEFARHRLQRWPTLDAQSEGRTFMEQRFLLELDGKPVGRLFDFKGGEAKDDVVATGVITRKHLDAVEHADMILACGTGMSRTFYDWLSSTFRRSYARKNGAVISLDPRSNPIRRLDFSNALISSLAMPALDATSKDPAHMRITIRPQRTSFSGSTGSQSVGAYSSVIAMAWRTNSFRIKIDGLESDCQHVTKIDALTLKQENKVNAVGERRDYEIEPTALEFPHLILELPKTFAGKFAQWMSSVVGGQNPSDGERNGTLDFLAPRAVTSYFGLKLNGLGIYKVTPSAASVKVELYCTKMEFSASSAAIK